MKILKIFSFKKVLSVTITVSLLLTVVSPGVFASNNIDQSSVFDKSSIINSKYGEITDSADTGSNITVINIQDLHCHLQTQQNINNILKEIDNKISFSLRSMSRYWSSTTKGNSIAFIIVVLPTPWPPAMSQCPSRRMSAKGYPPLFTRRSLRKYPMTYSSFCFWSASPSRTGSSSLRLRTGGTSFSSIP